MGPLESLTNPAENEAVRAVAAAFAGMERDFRAAIQAHYAALGIDPPPDRPPAEERIDQLCLLVSHHFRGDLWGYFCAEQAPDALERPDDARAFAGQSDAEWEASMQQLAAAAPDDIDGSSRERAAAVIADRFGVGLDTFEREIVGWTPERTLRRALRGPMDTDIERLRRATAALEQSD